MDSLGISAINLNSMISVQPKKGSLTTTEKPTNVQVFFHAKKEVKVDHQPVLRCQVKERQGVTHQWQHCGTHVKKKSTWSNPCFIGKKGVLAWVAIREDTPGFGPQLAGTGRSGGRYAKSSEIESAREEMWTLVFGEHLRQGS